MDFSYKFPENFTGHIVVNQNNIIAKHTSRILCGVILTKIAQQNNWETPILFEEIKEMSQKYKVGLFALKKDIIDPIADLVDLEIIRLKKKENDWFIIANPKLAEIMERFGSITN